MENSIVNAGSSLPSERIADYVHDVAKLEDAIFTLKKAEEECRQKSEEISESISEKIEKTRKKLKKTNSELWKEEHPESATNFAGSKPEKEPWLPDLFSPIFDNAPVGCFVAYLVFCLFIGANIGIPAAIMLAVNGDFAENVLACILPGVALMILEILIFATVKNVKRNREYKAEMQKYNHKLTVGYQSYLRDLKEAAEESRKEIDELEDSLSKDEQRLRRLNEFSKAQLTDLRNKRGQLETRLGEFYSLGIIPPDYRYAGCAFALDFIFRNDLADTMREAIFIYRDDVKHDEIKRGLENIRFAIDRLTSSMQAISDRLQSINTNVSMMSQDFYNFSERMARSEARNQKNAEKLIEETKLSRYATEELKETAKKLESYRKSAF